MTKLRFAERNISVARRGLLALVAGLLAAVTGTLTAPAPASAAYATTATFTTTVGADPADVYYPVAHSSHAPWPVVLLLQGANVDKSQYATFAGTVASYGFVVVVPNHYSPIFGGLYATGAEAGLTVAWAALENVRSGSPIAGAIDPGTLMLLGHSFGGAAGLSLATGLCGVPFCLVPTPAPAQLKAAAFYGTNNTVPGTGINPPTLNVVPVALVQGSLDGKAIPAEGHATYAGLIVAPKLYVSLTGANHYGITEVQNPAGAQADPSAQTLNQATGIETAARWSAYWLRAQLGDPVGQAWVHGLGDALDTDVTTEFVR